MPPIFKDHTGAIPPPRLDVALGRSMPAGMLELKIRNIVEDLKRQIRNPPINLTESDITDIFGVMDGKIDKKVENILETIAFLLEQKTGEKGEGASIVALLYGNSEKGEVKFLPNNVIDPDQKPTRLIMLLNSDPFYSHQLARILPQLKGPAAREIFINKFFDYFDRNIVWKPFIREISKYDDASLIGMFEFDHEIDNYVKRFTPDVVTGDYARYELGLDHLIKFLSGKDLRAKENDDRNLFYTTADGDVFFPLFVDTFRAEDPSNKDQIDIARAKNLRNWKISTLHEIGHHLWETFEINCHPEVLDYSAFGLDYMDYDKKDRKLIVRKTGEKDEHAEITELSGLCMLVDFPGLLNSLHNIIDDARCDLNNIKAFEGASGDYKEDIIELFQKKEKREKRTALEGQVAKTVEGIEKLLDAVHEQVYLSVIGKTTVTLPQEMAAQFDAIKAILDEPSNTSTDSLNKAIRIYRLLEPEARKAAEAMKGMKPRHGGRPGSLTFAKGIVKIVNKPPPKLMPGEGGVAIPVKYTGGAGGKQDKPQAGQSPGGAVDPTQDQVLGTYHYDEYVDRGYKRKAHTVVEIKAGRKDVIEISQAEKDKLKRVFEQYAPRQGVLERFLEEGDVDDELFSEWFAAYRAGRIEERTYHYDVVYEERDVATAVMVDFSGSMREVLEFVLREARKLAEVTQILKDPLLVAGLNEGEHGTEFYVVKDWHEKDIMLARYGGGATPLAGPFRHLTTKMGKHGIKEKGLKQVFFFTDGDANVGEQPIEDAAMAIKEAWNKHRIKTFAIGIAMNEEHKKSIEQFLDKLVGKGNYLVLLTSELGRITVFFERYYRKIVNKLM